MFFKKYPRPKVQQLPEWGAPKKSLFDFLLAGPSDMGPTQSSSSRRVDYESPPDHHLKIDIRRDNRIEKRRGLLFFRDQ